MRDVVETEYDGDRVAGLVTERRVDGTADAHQERVVVTTSEGGDLRRIDTAAARVDVLEGAEADLVRSVVGDRLEGSA